MLALAAGCSQIVGFKDVTLEEKEDGGTGSDADASGDAAIDAMPDAIVDAMIDGPPPNLYVFRTSGNFIGSFGAAAGARATADIKCQDIYNLAYSTKGCALANIHAVIHIDDTVDSLARMDITFPIPQGVQLKRITDETVVAQSWDEFINPNAALIAPVDTGASAVTFWSGRGSSSNMTCSGWTATGGNGNAGDLTKVNQWTNQSAPACSSANQKLLCICW